MFLDVNIDKHKILFEDVKRPDSSIQIPYTGIPFVILGKKNLDCTHGVDRCLSTKKKRLEAKFKVFPEKYLILPVES